MFSNIQQVIQQKEKCVIKDCNGFPTCQLSYVSQDFAQQSIATLLQTQKQVIYADQQQRGRDFYMDFELEGEELSSSLIITKDVDVFNWEALCLSSKLKTYIVNSKIDEVTLDILKTVDVLIVNISQLPKIHKIVNQEISTISTHQEEQDQFKHWIQTQEENKDNTRILQILKASIANPRCHFQFVCQRKSLKGYYFQRVIYDVVDFNLRHFILKGKFNWILSPQFSCKLPAFMAKHSNTSQQIDTVAFMQSKTQIYSIQVKQFGSGTHSDIKRDILKQVKGYENFGDIKSALQSIIKKSILYTNDAKLVDLLKKTQDDEYLINIYINKNSSCQICLEPSSSISIIQQICCGFPICINCFYNSNFDVKKCPGCRSQSNIPYSLKYIEFNQTAQLQSLQEAVTILSSKFNVFFSQQLVFSDFNMSSTHSLHKPDLFIISLQDKQPYLQYQVFQALKNKMTVLNIQSSSNVNSSQLFKFKTIPLQQFLEL